MLEILENTYLNNFLPNKNMSIRESMVKCNGRWRFRQYLQKIPIKRGFKIWIRADEIRFIFEF